MASVKNNTQSNGDSTVGFKTVAFGFDKNDVTLYIASLRKKMKQMEEEFEEKLSKALDNPAASNEALKHEREVIRSEMEKIWGNKLNERNAILKQQQERITELEKQIKEDNDTIDSLKTQLSAVTSDSDTDGSVLTARAAKAYMQFATELKSISNSIDLTLDNMEKTWKGEFVEEITALEEEAAAKAQTVQAAKAAAAVNTAPPATVTVEKPVEEKTAKVIAEPQKVEAAPVSEVIPEPKTEPVSEPKPVVVDQPVTETVSKPNPEPAPQTENKSEPLNKKALKEEKKEEKKAKKVTAQAPAPVPAPAPAPKPAAPIKPITPSFSLDDLLEEDDDPLKGIIADLSEDTTAVYADEKPAASKKPLERTEEKAASKKNIPESTAKTDFMPKENAAKSENSVQSTVDDLNSEFDDLLAENDVDDDLMSLMADVEEVPAPKPAPKPTPAPTPAPAPKPVPKPSPKPAPKPAPKIDIDDDLSSLLADEPDDNDIKPIDNTVGATDDFADLLLDNKNDDIDDDIIITGDESKATKGDDLDVSLLSNMVIDPNDVSSNGDLGQMIEDQEKRELEEFGSMFVTEADENDPIVFPEESSQKPKRDDDNPFDFSFMGSDFDDEDDMSTDVSFSGML